MSHLTVNAAIFPSGQSAQAAHGFAELTRDPPSAKVPQHRTYAGGPVPLLLAELARRSQTMRRRSRQGSRRSGPGAVAPFVPLYAALPPACGSGCGGLPSRLSVLHTRSSGCLPRSASGIRPHASSPSNLSEIRNVGFGGVSGRQRQGHC